MCENCNYIIDDGEYDDDEDIFQVRNQDSQDVNKMVFKIDVDKIPENKIQEFIDKFTQNLKI